MNFIRRIFGGLSAHPSRHSDTISRPFSVLIDRFPSVPEFFFKPTTKARARAILLGNNNLKDILSNDGWDRRGIVKPLWATNAIDGGLRVSCQESSNPLLAILVVTSAIKSPASGDGELIYGMISVARALTRKRLGEKICGATIVEALKLSVLYSDSGEEVVIFAIDEEKKIRRLR